MKGASIVTSNDNFIVWAAPVLINAGFHVRTARGCLQVSENGRLFTMYDLTQEGLEFIFPADQPMENRSHAEGMTWHCLADCRWEDLFCRVIQALGAQAQGSFVVVDNGAKVQLPKEVRPETISL